MSTVFKLIDGDVTRRLAFPEQPTWAALAAKVAAIFAIPEEHLGLSYIDSENDEITLNSEEELQDFFFSIHLPSETIKFTVKNLLAFRPSHGGLPYQPPGPQVECTDFPFSLPLTPPPMYQPPFGLAYPTFALIYGVPPALSPSLRYNEPPRQPCQHRRPHSPPLSPYSPPRVPPRCGHGQKPTGQGFGWPTLPFTGRQKPSPPSFWPGAPVSSFGPHSHPPVLPHDNLGSPYSPSPNIPPPVGEPYRYGAFPGLPHHKDFLCGRNLHGVPPGQFRGDSLGTSRHNRTFAQGLHNWTRATSPDIQSDTSSPGRRHREHSRNLHH